MWQLTYKYIKTHFEHISKRIKRYNILFLLFYKRIRTVSTNLYVYTFYVVMIAVLQIKFYET